MTSTQASVARPRMRGAFDRVKVFSATTLSQRHALGEEVTRWMAEHPEIKIVDLVVVQSSDAEFHCLTICVFYRLRSESRG